MFDFHVKQLKEFYPDKDAYQLFLIPVVRRCREFVNKKESSTAFRFSATLKEEDLNEDMTIRWDSTSEIPISSTPEEKTVTEHASLGIAHLIFPGIIDREIGERAKIGSRCDYWLGYERETLLEVSGIYKTEEKPEARIRQKIQNLEKSPFYNGRLDSVDSYISVTHFKEKRSLVQYVPRRRDDR